MRNQFSRRLVFLFFEREIEPFSQRQILSPTYPLLNLFYSFYLTLSLSFSSLSHTFSPPPHLSIYLYIYLPIYLSTYLSVYLNIYFDECCIKYRYRPYIIGDNMADQVVKCGKNLSWDIQYGGEPAPTATWYFADEKVLPSERWVTKYRYKVLFFT